MVMKTFRRQKTLLMNLSQSQSFNIVIKVTIIFKLKRLVEPFKYETSSHLLFLIRENNESFEQNKNKKIKFDLKFVLILFEYNGNYVLRIQINIFNLQQYNNTSISV
ncbi:hypothetical protein Anas_03401 [Armadillidium nasatum]|uniref:Uncharacterized protein n=1 Tax=Armadillidium nasatum TaxID=96803 RepID=A0A5N5T2I6_9CRUS|nr:hypothetical protein Anas_03401 [Armadillidium nasatum]